LEVEELQLFEMEDLTREKIAPVTLLEDARSSGRTHNRTDLLDETQTATLLG
jgi:hypothetical protein